METYAEYVERVDRAIEEVEEQEHRPKLASLGIEEDDWFSWNTAAYAPVVETSLRPLLPLRGTPQNMMEIYFNHVERLLASPEHPLVSCAYNPVVRRFGVFNEECFHWHYVGDLEDSEDENGRDFDDLSETAPVEFSLQDERLLMDNLREEFRFAEEPLERLDIAGKHLVVDHVSFRWSKGRYVREILIRRFYYLRHQDEPAVVRRYGIKLFDDATDAPVYPLQLVRYLPDDLVYGDAQME